MASAPGPRSVVILLGWTGSKQRNLRRYERMYRKMGYKVVTRPVELREFVVPTEESKPDVRILLRRAMAHNPQNLVIQFFSNGGGILYVSLRTVLETEVEFRSLRPTLKAVICDSAPSRYISPFAIFWLSFIVSNSNSELLTHLPFGITLALKTAVMWPFSGNPLDWYRPALLAFSPKVPELYLYSNGDNIITSVI
ncbi:hypothetical protein AAMO2058_001438700 [Amorphochlora amoebiformis]